MKKSRAKLEGCILGAYTKVGAKADLSRCVTQPGYDVPAGGTIILTCTTPHPNGVLESLRHEKLEISDWAAHETSEDQDSDESENESTEEESDD